MSRPDDVRLLEATPGRERRRALGEMAADQGAEGRSWVLDVHFHHGGLWAGFDDLFRDLLPAIEEQRPDLVRRHDYELAHIVPEIRRRIEVRNPTLTDTASYVEKTRNYPADRAYRIVHGLIDFLDAWREHLGDDPRWVLALDHADHLGHFAVHFLREMIRRRGDRWNLAAVCAIDPGASDAARDRLGLGDVPVVRLDLAPEPPAEVDPERARVEAEALARRVGEDQIEIQLHLADLIRLWREAGDDRQVFRWRCWGLEIYNTLGFYEDALAYGEGTLAEAERYAPDNLEGRWSIFVKLFMSLVGLGRAEEALELALPMFSRLGSGKNKGQLCYLIAMLYGRFLPERDYPRSESYLNQGLALLRAADLPTHEYHFQVVFNRNGLAMIRAFQGQLDDALELCREGIEQLEENLAPDQHQLHRSVLFYNMAQVQARIGAIDQALASFTSAMEMDPNYSEYYNERGSLLMRLGRLDEALDDYRRALELSPPYHELYSNLGQCFRLGGRFEEAVRAYDRSLDLLPGQILPILGRAQALEQLGREEEAMADYDTVLAAEPERWQARAARAVLHYGAGDHEASRIDLDRAIEKAPEVPDLYQNRAVVLTDLGLVTEATTDLETYLRLSPDAPDAREVEAQIDSLRARPVVVAHS